MCKWGFCYLLLFLFLSFISQGVVPNDGQYPNAKGESQTYLSTGPLCKYFEDLVPMFKVMAGPEDVSKLKLDLKVTLDA